MKALQVFESVARLRSFKDAAEELCVTPAAVSFQIRQLEKNLDTPLFERKPTGIAPTPAGEAFIPKLTSGIETLHQAFQDFLDHSGETTQPVRVTSGPAVMSKWLVPQVRHLKKEKVGLDIEFSADLSFVDLVRDNIDFAIRFGHIPEDRYLVEEIAEEYLVPAISPSLSADLHTPADLVQFDLIHDQSLQLFKDNAPNWESWFDLVGLPYDNQNHGMSFSQSDHAIQAAASGAGVALVRLVLAGPELLSGQLTTPFGPALPTGLKYYLLSQHQEPQTQEQEDVKDWLTNNISQTFKDLTGKAAKLRKTSAQSNVPLKLFRAAGV